MTDARVDAWEVLEIDVPEVAGFFVDALLVFCRVDAAEAWLAKEPDRGRVLGFVEVAARHDVERNNATIIPMV